MSLVRFRGAVKGAHLDTREVWFGAVEAKLLENPFARPPRDGELHIDLGISSRDVRAVSRIYAFATNSELLLSFLSPT